MEFFYWEKRGVEKRMKKLLLIGLLIGVMFFLGCIEAGKGTATDSIARISYDGVVWKTWKIQLTNDHPTSDSYERYGVINDIKLIQKLQHYAETGERVKIYYTIEWFPTPWIVSDGDIIYDVKSIKKEEI